MASQTGIEWCDATWNPVVGCSRVSPGCANCYAERFACRIAHTGKRAYQDVTTGDGCNSFRRWNGRTVLVDSALEDPLRWRKARSIFVCSMGDLFHPMVPDEWIAQVWQVMADTPQHTYMVLTKRADRMLAWLRKWWNVKIHRYVKRGGHRYRVSNLFLRRPDCSECGYGFLGCLRGHREWKDEAESPNFRPVDHRSWFGHETSVCDGFKWDRRGDQHGVAVALSDGWIGVRDDACVGGFPGPLKNVWLGASAEDRQRADERIPLLLQTPAAVRFVSFEPLLGPIDLIPTQGWNYLRGDCGLRTETTVRLHSGYPPLDWIIVGCESGPKRRPCKIEWVRSIVHQCHASGVPVFVKQLDIGGIDHPQWGAVNRDPEGWPADLRVREWPKP